MQVELAQLEYMLPRLTRMWTHLEKFRGGIGMRGPGETQLETDRRLINHRIKILRERLHDVQRGRAIQRQSRQSEFKASLVGYTNAGKSSILRALSGAGDIFVENRLFATLDPLTRDVDLGDNAHVLVTDTVGFIRKLPAPSGRVVSRHARGDARRRSAAARHRRELADVGGAASRGAIRCSTSSEVSDRPTLLVFNKIDLLDHDALLALQERIGALVAVVDLRVDRRRGRTRAACAARSRRRFAVARPLTPRSRMSPSDGKLLAEIHRDGRSARISAWRATAGGRSAQCDDVARRPAASAPGAEVSNGKAPALTVQALVFP